MDESTRSISNDNVYIGKYYKTRVYSIADAIKAHQESHHPTLYNVPDAPLIAKVELYMQAEKKTRFVDNFSRIALIPHAFDHGEARTVLFLAKTQEIVNEAQSAGATLAGGVELIKEIQNGKLQLTDFQYVLAHPNILSELVVLRGLLKKRFPNPKAGTLGVDINDMVQRYLNGIQYRAVKDEFQQDFGLIEAVVGKLNMGNEKLEENLVYLLKDINEARPRREGRFITKCKLWSPPSTERFLIDPFLYVPENYEKASKDTSTTLDEESDDEEERQQREATAA